MKDKKIVNRGNTIEFYDPDKVEKYLRRYVPEELDVSFIVGNISEYVELEEEVTSLKIQEEIYAIVEGLISAQEAYWQDVAGCIKADIHRKEVFNSRGFEKGLLKVLELGEQNFQYTNFYKKYTTGEVAELDSYINHERDYYLNHVGAHIAYDRYTTSIPVKENIQGKEIVKGIKKIETLQERYMAIAMFLLQDEKNDRIKKVKEAYDTMSGTEIAVDMTPATPTFMNSGRPEGNLSSCFIGMVDDSIDGIYRDAKQFASISKNAGGYGLYFGKVRSIGASIRNKPGLSSGSTPFMKLFDVTAGAVDQQG
jgi:ribonucleoside-diphosphate reductase alpha chain